MRDIDEIICRLSDAHPEISHEQRRVLHPGADDDGLWFFRHPDCLYEVQLEALNGQCPFLFESEERHTPATAGTVAEAFSMVAIGLGLAPPQPN